MNIIKMVVYIKTATLIKWLKGGDVPDALKESPIHQHISLVQEASDNKQIVALASEYAADIILMDSILLQDPIREIAKMKESLPNTRLIVIIGNSDQDTIDYCIDNEIYDIALKANSGDLKKMLLQGKRRNDVIELRSNKTPERPSEAPVEEETPEEIVGVMDGFSGSKKRPGGAMVVSVFSMKSIGRTTVLLNTALAMKNLGMKVMCVDHNMLGKDLGAYVGIPRGKNGIEKFYSGSVGATGLESLISTVHDIDVLSMGSSTEMASLPESSIDVQHLIESIHKHKKYDVILFDLSADLNTRTNRQIIKQSDRVLLVVNQLPPSVENMYSQVTMIKEFCDVPDSDIGLVINNFKDNGIPASKIESYLKVTSLASIPSDVAGFDRAVTERVPYTILFPKKTNVIEAYKSLAKYLLSSQSLQEVKGPNGLMDKLKSIFRKGGNKA